MNSGYELNSFDTPKDPNGNGLQEQEKPQISSNASNPFSSNKTIRLVLYIIIGAIVFGLIFAMILMVALRKDTNVNTDKDEDEEDEQIGTLTQRICRDDECHAVWFYGADPAFESEEIAVKMAQWTSTRWNTVFLSLPIHKNIDKPDLGANYAMFVKKLHSFGVYVHVMTLQDTSFITNSMNNEMDIPLSYIESIINWRKEYALEDEILGIHSDCEPHAHEKWKSDDDDEKRSVWEHFIKLTKACADGTHKEKNLVFSTAVAWYLPNRAFLNDPKGDLLKSGNDFFVPMIYAGAGITAKNGSDRTDLYRSFDAATMTGYSPNDYNKDENAALNAGAEAIATIKESRSSGIWVGDAAYPNYCFSGWAEAGGQKTCE